MGGLRVDISFAEVVRSPFLGPLSVRIKVTAIETLPAVAKLAHFLTSCGLGQTAHRFKSKEKGPLSTRYDQVNASDGSST